MASGEFEFPTRLGLLEGLPARRARTLLFTIESRTAYLVSQSRQAMELFLTPEAAEERNLAFLQALSLGRDPPLRPTIQDLEHYATQWAFLVPKNPNIRAAVAHLLAQKYNFTYRAVPRIQAALGLNEEAVQQAYQRLYHEPLKTIFATGTGPTDWLRWAWDEFRRRIDSLSPFWTAFAMTLTTTVGAGYLALPIALAGIGPLAGVLVILLFGLVNVVTIAFTAEAITRSGAIRYGSVFMGRVVADYLGPLGALIFTAALFADCWLGLMYLYVGFSTTLADATHTPAILWIGVLFVAGIYFVRRKSLNATVASALVIGAVNIGLILLLSLLTFERLQPANLWNVNMPFLSTHIFDRSLFYLVFGVVLSAYFGHLSVGNCAQVLFRRDPGGRSLISGAVAAQAAAMAVYCIWVLAVNGAVAPQMLAEESGTALIPLAVQIGPIVYVFGSVLVILGMGMVSIHTSLGLFNLTREWLPTKREAIVRLARRKGQLILESNEHGRDSAGALGSGLRIGVTYIGLANDKASFRLDIQNAGEIRHTDINIAVTANWDATTLIDQLPKLRQHGLHLYLQVKEANQQTVLMRVSSTMRLTYKGAWDTIGLTMADILTLPEDQRRLINWLRRRTMRQETVSLAEVAAYLGQDEAAARSTMDTLMAQGFVESLERQDEAAHTHETHYQLSLALKRGRLLSEEIWKTLDRKGLPAKHVAEPGLVGKGWLWQYAGKVALAKRARSTLLLIPAASVFLLTEWLVLTGAESFTGILSFCGVITASLLAGIFPALLIVTSRKKSERLPGVTYRLLGHPFLTAGIFLLFVAALFLHGLFIWQDLIQRAVALAVGVITLGMTIAIARRGAFAYRMVLELQDDQRQGRAGFTITQAGQPVAADVRLGYDDAQRDIHAATGEITPLSTLRYASFQLPASQARDLKVWAHRITFEGDSQSLPVILEVRSNGEKRFDLRLSDGQVLVPLKGGPCYLTIRFTDAT